MLQCFVCSPIPKVSEKRGNWSEFHSERNYYIQNWYFNKSTGKETDKTHHCALFNCMGFREGLLILNSQLPYPPKKAPGPCMWDEITVSLANESIESLEIESPRTREMDLGTNFPAVHPAFQLNIGNVKLRAFNVWKKEDKIFVNTIIF